MVVLGDLLQFFPQQQQQQQQQHLECELYLADSTIPGAGMGVFTGAAKQEGDFVGNGDKAMPLVDVYWHNGFQNYDEFFIPTAEYVWDGVGMGMRLELFDTNDISAFWPGIDALVNCHFGLLNLEKATPVYDEGGIHRSKHHGAGAVSPYEASSGGSSFVKRDIPAGGEMFKSYGENWFLSRQWLGKIPLGSDYELALELMGVLKEGCEYLGILPSILYDEIIQPMKNIWDSRTLNALYHFSWNEVEHALDANDIGILLQPNATRSLDFLNEHGKCLDHIVHKGSNIDGAGAGAFAKRDLPKGTTITGTPLLVFPDIKWFDMYDFQVCPDGSTARDVTKGPYGQQLLLNYCFGHPESSMVLCPLGSGVNYINHNQTRANVRVQWANDGVMGHKDEFLKKQPGHITDYSTRVAFDYVATKDIAQGEELFLDYGDVWETQFHQLREDWQTFDRSFLDAYVSATEYNLRYPMDPLYTSEELRSFNPHPENLSLRCHFLVDEASTEEDVFAYDGDPSELSANWEHYSGDITGFPCEVMVRVGDGDGASYVVQIKNHEKEDFRIVSNVPREAIKFFDNPYTTDIHMIGAFRQTLGIPDDMLPDAWRRTAGDETQQKDFASDQGSHATDDACARNPYRQQKEQEQHQHQHQLQHQNYNQLQHNRNRRVRHIGSSVRGR